MSFLPSFLQVLLGVFLTTFDGDIGMELSLWKRTLFHNNSRIGERVSRMFHENCQISRNGREWT
jgi:hypothetical protein